MNRGASIGSMMPGIESVRPKARKRSLDGLIRTCALLAVLGMPTTVTGQEAAGHSLKTTQVMTRKATLRILKPAGGWDMAESDNFLIHHRLRPTALEEVVRSIENLREDYLRKWIGVVDEAWKPKCDVFLYSTEADYRRQTGQTDDGVHGHSNLVADGGRVMERKIYQHMDYPRAEEVRRHELSHVTLDGLFSLREARKWALEGIAKNNEPASQIQEYWEYIYALQGQQGFYHVKDLFALRTYPPSRSAKTPAEARAQHKKEMSAFYLQSGTLVNLLIRKRDPQPSWPSCAMGRTSVTRSHSRSTTSMRHSRILNGIGSKKLR